MNYSEGKVAIVTGGGNRVGAAYVRPFDAAAGVVLADIDSEAAAETAASTNADGGRALAVTTDVGDPERVRAVAF